MFPQLRLRRLRQNATLRKLLQENHLHRDDLIYPVFIVPGTSVYREIKAMPGQYQYSVDQLDRLIPAIKKSGILAVLLFGQTESKNADGSSATDPNAAVIQAIKVLKKALPDLMIMTDVCLCSYTDHGHCGPLFNGQVDNDATLKVIRKMALQHAKAGADFVAPSGMMDGMVGAIREALDQADFSQTGILSYSVKYASSFYGPFREAADSTPQQGDRKSYQMNPANALEALREADLDVAEGADMLMVKPGMPYLDIISKLRAQFDLPILAYQVSGEYSMIKAAGEKGWINEKSVILESLLGFKRAGATAIITYFALDVANWL
ncbi:MAG: porphobilinogen synthase [Gammaproteobacteria bacterium]|jgi:porphobilinogen synthase|nr:porphobilinogen synthase [Gammaproteobacteria bacterium]